MVVCLSWEKPNSDTISRIRARRRVTTQGLESGVCVVTEKVAMRSELASPCTALVCALNSSLMVALPRNLAAPANEIVSDRWLVSHGSATAWTMMAELTGMMDPCGPVHNDPTWQKTSTPRACMDQKKGSARMRLNVRIGQYLCVLFSKS